MIEDGALVLQCDFQQSLVNNIKALPYTDRKWDQLRKVWIIHPKHAREIVSWVDSYLYEQISVPSGIPSTGTKETKTLRVEYVGQCRSRDGIADYSASGCIGNEWSVIFPEDVLRKFFNSVTRTPVEQRNFYSVLCLKNDAAPQEIKSSYRRLALQWHPDRCQEPDAKVQFMAIQHAYDVLSNENEKLRYDAGLKLEALMVQSTTKVDIADGFRSPLLCGNITCIGEHSVGRFIVDEIKSWEDIVENGKTMTVSWPQGASTFIVSWV
jgi:hypothetical protein